VYVNEAKKFVMVAVPLPVQVAGIVVIVGTAGIVN
jgi:hypothetical protein